jgi:hypothetical protein
VAADKTAIHTGENMGAYENARAEAAKWMFDREAKDDNGSVHWWQHNVLTKQTPAADKGVHTFVGLILHKRGAQTVTDTLNSLLAASVTENVH